MRQLMTESLILAMAGGVAGLLVAYGGIRLLQTLSVPSDPPSVLGVQLDWRVVQFSLLAALASCVFFGLVPAWQTARTDFVSALKTGGEGASGKRRTFGRDVLVAGQIALAMVVLIAAGMFLAGFRKMLVMPPEFRTDHLISLDTAPAVLHYSPEQTKAFYRRLVDRVRTMAGVAGVAMTESLPLSPSQTVVTVVPEGYQFPKGREKAIEFGAAVDAAYFSTMNVEIKRGRAFTDDDRAGSRRVAIVNQQFAKTYWPGQDPIGKRIRLDSADGPAAEVVGVAKTGHYLAVNEAPAPFVYLPYEQNPRSRMTLIVQSVGDAGCARKAFARRGSIDRRQPADIQPPDRSDALRKPRDRYVAAVLPDGGDDGIHRSGARHDRALWAGRLHGEPPREGVRHTRRPRREPPRRCVACRAPRADSRRRWYRDRRSAHRGGSTPTRRGLSRTRRIFPRCVRSCCAGVADGQRGCKLCAGTARRGAGSAAGPAERIASESAEVPSLYRHEALSKANLETYSCEVEAAGIERTVADVSYTWSVPWALPSATKLGGRAESSGAGIVNDPTAASCAQKTAAPTYHRTEPPRSALMIFRAKRSLDRNE